MDSLLNELEIKYFKDLTQLNGVSGNEKQVAHYLVNEYSKLGLELVKDNLGSIFALKKSRNNPTNLRVMIDAHMDEVGFIVKEIKDNGLVVPYPLGGFNYQTLLSNRVTLTTEEGKTFEGAIDSTPPHLLKGQSQEVNRDNLLMDFGFFSKEDALNNGVEIGNMISLKGEIEFLNGGKRILSKALDDRYGIILGLDILNILKDTDLPFDLYVGGSTQEEVGLRGVQTIYQEIKPDFAFVLDCSTAKDSISNSDFGKIGSGVLLRFVDSNMIASKALLKWQKEAVAKTNGKYQYFETMGGTNAGQVHLRNVMTLTHCICARSIHTQSSIMDVSDYISARDSLVYMLKDFNRDKFNEFKESRY